MNSETKLHALETAVGAAKAAGQIMRDNMKLPKTINEEAKHDIKLELDVQCQKTIETAVLEQHPDIAILGEEGVRGDIAAPHRWVIDPIDGTVNFTHEIPHACVSIALQERFRDTERFDDLNYRNLLGVVYDPFQDEIWTATDDGPAELNGSSIQVSERELDQSIVTLGFAKSAENIEFMMPAMEYLAGHVRKLRMMGSAALSMTYVASGRFDGYIERGIRLWDVAAGGLILERAGGIFRHEPLDKDHFFRLCATNQRLQGPLSRFVVDD